MKENLIEGENFSYFLLLPYNEISMKLEFYDRYEDWKKMLENGQELGNKNFHSEIISPSCDVLEP